MPFAPLKTQIQLESQAKSITNERLSQLVACVSV